MRPTAAFFEQPILNSPYEYPSRHRELDPSGQPTNRILSEELDRVVLTDDLADPGLNTGDDGKIVHVHQDGEAFDVEFQAPDGDTVTLATVSSSPVRLVTGTDITDKRN